MSDASEATTFTIPKFKINLKTIAAVLLLLGFTNVGDLFKAVKGFFGRGNASPELIQEIAARKAMDSVLIDTMKITRYELKKVKKQNIRFQVIQMQNDPKLRAGVERATSESGAVKARMERDEKLLEELGE